MFSMDEFSHDTLKNALGYVGQSSHKNLFTIFFKYDARHYVLGGGKIQVSLSSPNPGFFVVICLN